MAARHPFDLKCAAIPCGGVPCCGAESSAFPRGGSAAAHLLQGVCCVPCVYAVGTTAACQRKKTKQQWYPDEMEECAMCCGMYLLSLLMAPIPFMGCYTRVYGAKQDCLPACLMECFPVLFCAPCAMATFLESPGKTMDEWGPPPATESKAAFAQLL